MSWAWVYGASSRLWVLGVTVLTGGVEARKPRDEGLLRRTLLEGAMQPLSTDCDGRVYKRHVYGRILDRTHVPYRP